MRPLCGGGGLFGRNVIIIILLFLLHHHPCCVVTHAFVILRNDNINNNKALSLTTHHRLNNDGKVLHQTTLKPPSQQRRRRKQQQQGGVQQYRFLPRIILKSAIDETTVTTSSETETSNNNNNNSKPYKHGLAILTMPSTSLDKIANEAILQTILQKTWKLSVYLRASDETKPQPSLSSLRRYIGEIYSTLWDFCSVSEELEDVVVYAQNLPNTAPEQWIHHLDDLDCICSHDSICGWMTAEGETSGSGTFIMESDKTAKGGLDEHVKAVNDDRLSRDLKPVVPLHVSHWPAGACSRFNDDHNVVFLDDDALEDGILKKQSALTKGAEGDDDETTSNTSNTASSFLGGARIPSKALFTSVAVGGTFDGMHYGHRKLLTLAVSSVTPQTGKLLIGVTVDKMLQQKKYSEYIPTLQERMNDVKKFMYRLAPGLKNRIRIVPINNKFGPPGSLPQEEDTWNNDFDALVLSHETLQTGHELNLYRQEELGLPPLVLLCTRRTEAIGMSSTTLRKIRNDRRMKE